MFISAVCVCARVCVNSVRKEVLWGTWYIQNNTKQLKSYREKLNDENKKCSGRLSFRAEPEPCFVFYTHPASVHHSQPKLVDDVHRSRFFFLRPISPQSAFVLLPHFPSLGHGSII